MTTIAPTTTTQIPTAAAPAQAPAAEAPAESSGGGSFGDILKSGIGKLVSFASKGMQSISDALSGEMEASGGGSVDAAKVQGYVMQMTNYDSVMKLAAKLHESEKDAVNVWLR